ncbi:MAG: diguanylate cyclase [Cyanothece sp. SIO1E1]|nr:diguanylate cyclase [Cyanothece sp. SIO1E1]
MFARFKHYVPSKLNRLSLSAVLTLPFMLQTVGAVGLTGWLSLSNGRKNVDRLATELSTQITARIQSQVRSYLTTPYHLTQAFEATIASGVVNIEDELALRTFFWHQVQQTQPGTTLAYSNQIGEVVGIHKTISEDFLLLRQNESTHFHWHVYHLDGAGQPTKLVRRVAQPNQRYRPWHKAAQRQGKPTWSPIFQAQSIPALIMTAGHPLFNSDQELKGVLAVSITLSQVAALLKEFAVGSSGQAFIIDRAGQIVATSIQHPLLITTEDGQKRVSAIASSDPLIRAAADYLLKQFASFDQIKDVIRLTFPIKDQDHLIEVTPFRDGKGLDWLVAVAIPEADFTAQIQANTRRTVVLCAIALLITLLLGSWTSRWISRTVYRLKTAAEHIAQGKFDQIIATSPITELDQLASSFNHMAGQLQQSFADLESLNAALSESESRLKQFFEALPVGVSAHQHDGSIFYFNQTAKQLLGTDVIPDIKPDAFSASYHVYRAGTDQLYPTEELPILRALRGENLVIEDLEIRRPEKVHSFSARATPIFDGDGQITYAVVVFEDITARKQVEKLLTNYNWTLEAQVAERTEALQAANQELERLANLDGLTQVANRRYFDTYLAQEWQRLAREQQPLSLILFDVDFFKRYNDYYGHQAGDDCLIQVSQAVKQTIKRPADLVARYGGEEFAIVLPNTDIQGAIAIAQHIQAAIQSLQISHAQSEVSPFITISLGITCQIPIPGTDFGNLVGEADAALYKAKQQGRNRYCLIKNHNYLYAQGHSEMR